MGFEPRTKQEHDEVLFTWACNFFGASFSGSGKAEVHWAMFCNRCSHVESGKLIGPEASKFKESSIFSKMENHKNKKHKNLRLGMTANPAIVAKYVK